MNYATRLLRCSYEFLPCILSVTKDVYDMTLLEQANAFAQSFKSIEALTLYTEVLALEPTNAVAWNNRGNTLDDLGQKTQALASFDQALALNPRYAQALCNKGVVLGSMHRYVEALACFEQSIMLDPQFALAYTNRGNALRSLGLLNAAIDSHSRAIAIDPEFANAHWNQSLCRLLIGDYVQGWPQYEWRWLAPAPSGQMLETPRSTWLGKEPIAGKRIILWPEGGDGDVFQFVRFANLVQQRGAHVVLAVRPSTLRLFQHNFPQFELLAMTEGTPIPAWDAQCSLMSLPLACGIDSLQKIPAGVSYLSSVPEILALWHQRLQSTSPTLPRKRIGLVWAGNGITDVDQDRSLTLSQFEPLGKVALEHNFQLVSLQKGKANLESSPPLLDLTDELVDWADTAALIANLDLVISCDTGVAHLAAAMGKPTWILSRHNGCWRWLLNRTDSPWYPSVRLFRQPTFGDWATVVQKVANALVAQSQPHL